MVLQATFKPRTENDVTTENSTGLSRLLATVPICRSVDFVLTGARR